MDKAKVGLGQVVRDIVTGLKGVATGRVEYLTGCTQVLVQPKAKDDGAFVDSHWFDIDRIEAVASADAVTIPKTTNGCDAPAPRR